jgi:DNA-binding PadR family transcriptional regulator
MIMVRDYSNLNNHVKRRIRGIVPAMSSIRMLVLGVVRIFQPVHGYDVRRELLSWHADEWANVAPGSIYNAIKTLTREGALAVAGTDKAGARPERTSYQLTAAGDAELLRLLREHWREVKAPVDPLIPALAFLPMLPRAEVIEYLHERVAQIERIVGELRWAQKHMVAQPSPPKPAASELPRKPDGRVEFDDDYKPEHVYETLGLMSARIGCELEWAHGLLERLEQGRYQMAGDVAAAPTASRRGRGVKATRDRERPQALEPTTRRAPKAAKRPSRRRGT